MKGLLGLAVLSLAAPSCRAVYHNTICDVTAHLAVPLEACGGDGDGGGRE